MNQEGNTENDESNKIPQHNNFVLELQNCEGRYVTFTSDFDSGNLMSAIEESDGVFKLRPCSDIEGVTESKNWFYFKVKGFPQNYKARFVLQKMNCLHSFGKFSTNKKQYNYKPCRKINEGAWQKFEEGVAVFRSDAGDTRLKFEHTFSSEQEEVSFSFTYPYEYSKYISFIDELDKQYGNQKELVASSFQNRPIYILTITSSQQKRIQSDNRKPIVFITGRVHPGEVPASYTIEGIIRFLLSKKDLRAYILRRLFSFKIIPMLNPDGVYRGHYRMDSLGQNLNRYYNKDCKKEDQPAIYAVKNLIERYSKQEKLLFYFDLHAHAGRKGAFIYGNSISNFIQQVQASVFCRIMALNTPYFEYSCCNFSEKHMNHKDKYEALSKDNCGRVFAYKSSGIIHSFTLELGYHFTNLSTVTADTNTNFQIGKYKCTQNPRIQSKVFTPQSFAQIGQSLLISILDCLSFNPYTKIPNYQHQSLALLRRATAFALFQSDQKYKTFDMKIYPKVKNINSIIHQNYYQRIQKIYKLSETYNKLFHSSEWNHCVLQAKKIQQLIVQVETQVKKDFVEDKITKQDQIIEDVSEHSSEYSDDDEQIMESNVYKKTESFVIKPTDVRKGLLELSQMKYGSATIMKNNLPFLQSRGVTPTIRNLTADKEKKQKPVLQIQTLKLKIKQQFVKQLKSQLNKEQIHPSFNGSKIQRRQHRSLKKVIKQNTNTSITLANSNMKFGIFHTKEMSPINLKTTEAPRLSQIYLPFLSK